MTVPDFQSIMLPVLRMAADGQDHHLGDTVDALATQFELSELDREEPLPSGTGTRFKNRVAWARTYLKQAGLLESPKRGWVRITERGENVLAENPSQVDSKLLERFPEYLEFKSRRRNEDQESPSTIQFGIRPTRAWEPKTNKLDDRSRRQADVYVFCLLDHQEQETVDPLDLQQWTFFVLATRILDETLPQAKSISLSRLRSLNPREVAFSDLAAAVRECVS